MDPKTQGVVTEETPVQADPTPQTETTDVAAQAPAAEASTSEQDDELPTEPDKQREAFIRMRQENKALREQLGTSTAAPDEEAVLSQFRQRTVPQAQISADMDPNDAIAQMQQVAHQSQMASQQVVELQQQLEDERLFREFPELNPQNTDFKKPQNKAFEKFVAGQYVIEQLQGNKPDLVAIARRAKADFESFSQPQQQAAAQQATQNAARVEQAVLEAKGAHNNVPVAQPQEELHRDGARRGDPMAIARLLRRG